MTTSTKKMSILAQIADIESLSLVDLRVRWRELFGTDPPGYSRAHFIRRLAYRVQELAYGGLPVATKAALRAVAEADGTLAPDGGVSRLARRKANPGAPVAGTRLVREWRGRRFEVVVLQDGGFEFEGRRYKSLSAIAKAITGAHWNGKLFFGLRGRGGKGG